MTKPTGIGIGASVIALVALTAPLAGQAPARPAGTIAGATDAMHNMLSAARADERTENAAAEAAKK